MNNWLSMGEARSLTGLDSAALLVWLRRANVETMRRYGAVWIAKAAVEAFARHRGAASAFASDERASRVLRACLEGDVTTVFRMLGDALAEEAAVEETSVVLRRAVAALEPSSGLSAREAALVLSVLDEALSLTIAMTVPIGSRTRGTVVSVGAGKDSPRLERKLATLAFARAGFQVLDLGDVVSLDVLVAWFLERTGIDVAYVHVGPSAPPALRSSLENVATHGGLTVLVGGRGSAGVGALHGVVPIVSVHELDAVARSFPFGCGAASAPA